MVAEHVGALVAGIEAHPESLPESYRVRHYCDMAIILRMETVM